MEAQEESSSSTAPPGRKVGEGVEVENSDGEVDSSQNAEQILGGEQVMDDGDIGESHDSFVETPYL